MMVVGHLVISHHMLSLMHIREVRVIIDHTIMGLSTRLIVVISIRILSRHHLNSRSVSKHISIISIHIECAANKIITVSQNVIAIIH